MLHAGNRKQFVLKSRSGRLKPDFIAVDENGDPYALFEGKGSSDSGVKSHQIEHGKKQVEDVLSVTLKGAHGMSGVMKQGWILKNMSLLQVFGSSRSWGWCLGFV